MISQIYLAALFTCVVCSEKLKKVNIKKNQEACKKFGENPYFDPELIVGPPWRVYYTWKVMSEEDCLEMTYKNVNPWTVNHIWMDMAEYLEEQPAWGSAMLYVTIGSGKHQLLLFADRGPPGRVYGVPNLSREPSFLGKKKSVKLFPFQMKLLQGGQYLVVMDCLSGITSLSARFSEGPPTKKEIQSVAKELAIGKGFPSCLQ